MQASSHLAGQVLRQLAREHEHDEAKHPQDTAQDDETWGRGCFDQYFTQEC